MRPFSPIKSSGTGVGVVGDAIVIGASPVSSRSIPIGSPIPVEVSRRGKVGSEPRSLSIVAAEIDVAVDKANRTAIARRARLQVSVTLSSLPLGNAVSPTNTERKLLRSMYHTHFAKLTATRARTTAEFWSLT